MIWITQNYTDCMHLFLERLAWSVTAWHMIGQQSKYVKVPPRGGWLIARYTRPVAMCCGAREDDDDDSGNPGPDINRKCFGSRDYSDYTRRIAERKLSTSWQT